MAATPSSSPPERAQWGSRLGFILAAAGSAVGLGNVWKFPYVTGENGGGIFVLLYLASVLLVGLPIMVAEVIIGRRGQGSPVTAIANLLGGRTPWKALGWLGVGAGFVILSYYAVVAGWAVDYLLKAIMGAFWTVEPEGIPALFGTLYTSAGANLLWLVVFMGMTMGVVIGGVEKGIERWNRILMPGLFLLLLVLLVNSMLMDGFGEAMAFVFYPDPARFQGSKSILEAMGQGFFSLSLGMGAMLTYGSYLNRRADLLRSAVAISILDTLVALLAACILFPVIFTYGFEPQAGPGLVFKTLPVIFAQLPMGRFVAILFFTLLVFAAVTSSVSLLEVVSATVIERLGWSRRKAVGACGLVVFVFGIFSALSGSTLAGIQLVGERNIFDSLDYLAANWMLPLGGLGIALFVGWALPSDAGYDEYSRGSTLPGTYRVWRPVIRYLTPVALLAVFLNAIGVL